MVETTPHLLVHDVLYKPHVSPQSPLHSCYHPILHYFFTFFLSIMSFRTSIWDDELVWLSLPYLVLFCGIKVLPTHLFLNLILFNLTFLFISLYSSHIILENILEFHIHLGLSFHLHIHFIPFIVIFGVPLLTSQLRVCV